MMIQYLVLSGQYHYRGFLRSSFFLAKFWSCSSTIKRTWFGRLITYPFAGLPGVESRLLCIFTCPSGHLYQPSSPTYLLLLPWEGVRLCKLYRWPTAFEDCWQRMCLSQSLQKLQTGCNSSIYSGRTAAKQLPSPCQCAAST